MSTPSPGAGAELAGDASWLAPFALACVVAFAAVRLFARAARRRGGRAPEGVPRVGGAAVLLGWVAGASVSGIGAPFGITPSGVAASVLLAFLVGLLDDRRALAPAPKLALELASGLPLALAAALALADAAAARVGVACVALLAVPVAVNLANTFDHADGLLAGVAGLALALAGGPASAGAVAGFLPSNLDGEARADRARPTAYLGDAGSHVLGVLLLVHPLAWPAFLLPALDLARLSVVRVAAGSWPWVGDQRHLGHRLAARGLGPRAVALCVVLAAAPPLVALALAPGEVLLFLLGLLIAAGAYLGLLRATGGPRVA